MERNVEKANLELIFNGDSPIILVAQRNGIDYVRRAFVGYSNFMHSNDGRNASEWILGFADKWKDDVRREKNPDKNAKYELVIMPSRRKITYRRSDGVDNNGWWGLARKFLEENHDYKIIPYS